MLVVAAGRRKQGWKLRWVVLSDDRLLIYKSPAMDQCKSSVLVGAAQDQGQSKKDLKFKYLVSVTAPAGDTDSETERAPG